MSYENIRKRLIEDEDIVLHAYEDHLGYLTIGVGRLIDKRRGGGISREEAMMLLDNDIAARVSQLDGVEGFSSFPEPVQEALVNMCFQLGFSGLLLFKKMWAKLRNGDWSGAADEALDSRWAKQTPNRANRIADLIRSAED